MTDASRFFHALVGPPSCLDCKWCAISVDDPKCSRTASQGHFTGFRCAVERIGIDGPRDCGPTGQFFEEKT